MIIDVHGHLSAPADLYVYKSLLLAGRGLHGEGGPRLSDDSVRAAAAAHVAMLREVGTDVQLLSPRPFHLMHSEAPERIVRWWVEANNDVIARIVDMFPETFLGVCALPQQPSGDLRSCIEELDRCVQGQGFVGCLLNPDPSEGTAITPTLADEYWFPLYQRLTELDVPALLHPAGCRNPRLSYSLNFINEESIAIMSLLDMSSKVFATFPKLKIIVPHGGGSIPYQLGRWQSAARSTGATPFEERLRSLWYDTTLYTKGALELLISTVGTDRVMFGTELPGSGGGIDPATGRPMDDLKPVVESIAWLTDDDRKMVFEDNAVLLYGKEAFASMERRKDGRDG
jgi:predicted TIM-barrel fold metal-dependent hydrolase